TAGGSIIYHLAAGMEKSFAGAFMNSALGTRNLVDAFLERGEPKGFVNVSSFAVYSNLSLKRGALLDETCPLDDVHQERFDAYVFNVVDDELLSRRQFLKLYKAKLERSSVRNPYVAAYGLCFLWEKYAKWSNGQLPAVFNRRRCAAEWKGNRYSNQRLHERLDWKPRVPMKEAMEAFLAQFDTNGEDRDQMSELGSHLSEAEVKR